MMIKMVKYWFTSDTHFGHTNIIKYTGRPFKDATHMNEELIKRWNSKVQDGDIVFHLGDFCLGKGVEIKRFMERLNGQVIWIKGNHDSETIINDMVIRHGGHYWHMAHSPDDCHGEYNLCGHVHERWKIKRQKNGRVFVNVGVDVWNFYPIDINDILNLINGHLGK